MKNKESQKRINSTKSLKSKTSNVSQILHKPSIGKHFSRNRSASKGDEKSTKPQLERLKKFYYTTKWLPNTAFTTYFGKPAFENYGYGNTKPVYGGLFYGNYMLSHNINPIEGGNIPDTKQVYSSAMLKAIKRNDIRKPEPPRKTPEEIRNTPEELEEIKTRNPIFQLPNHFQGREIIKPDLLKVTYFKSGKNTPKKSSEDMINFDEEHEVFDIDDILNNKHLKKKKINSKILDNDFNPYEQGKVKLQKRKMKEHLDLRRKNNERSLSSLGQADKKIEAYNKEINDYESQRLFYEKMMKEENKMEDVDNQRKGERQILSKNNESDIKKEHNKIKKEFSKKLEEKEDCLACQKDTNSAHVKKLTKKENPCLLAPSETNHVNVCCLHGYEQKLPIEIMDPKNYKDRPPCTLSKIIPAGKPIKKSVTVAELFK